MGASFDPGKLEGMLGSLLRIIECLQKMNPGTRSRLFRVTSVFGREPLLIVEMEQLFADGTPESESRLADAAKWALEHGATQEAITAALSV